MSGRGDPVYIIDVAGPQSGVRYELRRTIAPRFQTGSKSTVIAGATALGKSPGRTRKWPGIGLDRLQAVIRKALP
jgi:hypothetical protein